MPPTYKLPCIPVPPVTCNAPLVVLVAAAAEVNVNAPLAASVVNAPVAAVLAPIGNASAYPPAIRALPVEKFVTTPRVAYTFATLLIYPPVITALPVLKFVATAVVKLPAPENCVALSTPVEGLCVSVLAVNPDPLPVVLSTSCG